MADKQDTTPNGWTGQLFRNDWLNTNPLVASIQGYPYQVRGTDPASAKASLDWAASGMQSSPTTPAGTPASLPGFSLMPDWVKSLAIGGTGVFVGLALLVIGLLVLLFGTDTGRKAVKSAAKAA